jgi:cytochrome c oxidase subunit 4
MSEHSPSTSTYFAVFFALLVLTFVTVVVAKIDLGPANTLVAMAVAVTKALLVILFFMHVKYGTRMTKLTALAGFAWLGLMILMIMSDYYGRGGIFPITGK